MKVFFLLSLSRQYRSLSPIPRQRALSPVRLAQYKNSGSATPNIFACFDGKSFVVVPLGVIDDELCYLFVKPGHIGAGRRT